MKVQLETDEGNKVGVFEVPPFQKLPEVMYWGSRVFVRHSPADGVPVTVPSFAKGAHGEVAGEVETPIYREGMPYAIVTKPID